MTDELRELTMMEQLTTNWNPPPVERSQWGQIFLPPLGLTFEVVLDWPFPICDTIEGNHD